jgi:predicted SAM-dependent methyltransferase
MKLHLGCGQKYLEGYRNIDYPPAEHTVQNTSVADEYCNISQLKYHSGSIEEVRLHHVFEHFERFSACAYLASWNSWLKTGGRIHIEVPDFETTLKKNFSRWDKHRFEGVGLRHIFGSQEAPWAVHYEGYSDWKLRQIVSHFGFETTEVIKSEYKRTFNIEIHAVKKQNIKKEEAAKGAVQYLSTYLVDDSGTEQRMLAVWMEKFNTQLDLTFAE